MQINNEARELLQVIVTILPALIVLVMIANHFLAHLMLRRYFKIRIKSGKIPSEVRAELKDLPSRDLPWCAWYLCRIKFRDVDTYTLSKFLKEYSYKHFGSSDNYVMPAE